MSKIVIGNYVNIVDAAALVQKLLNEGYPNDSLSLITGKACLPELKEMEVKVQSEFPYAQDYTEDSLWEKIKSFLGFDEAAAESETSIAAYHEDLQEGNTIVVIDNALVPSYLAGGLALREELSRESDLGLGPEAESAGVPEAESAGAQEAESAGAPEAKSAGAPEAKNAGSDAAESAGENTGQEE